MLQPRSIQSSLGIRDKILSLDYVLVISILVLGIISMFAMYSTDGGEFKYHTNSHILRFFGFFAMFFPIYSGEKCKTVSNMQEKHREEMANNLSFFFFYLVHLVLLLSKHIELTKRNKH